MAPGLSCAKRRLLSWQHLPRTLDRDVHNIISTQSYKVLECARLTLKAKTLHFDHALFLTSHYTVLILNPPSRYYLSIISPRNRNFPRIPSIDFTNLNILTSSHYVGNDSSPIHHQDRQDQVIKSRGDQLVGVGLSQ